MHMIAIDLISLSSCPFSYPNPFHSPSPSYPLNLSIIPISRDIHNNVLP
jgi:hypothetical protein